MAGLIASLAAVRVYEGCPTWSLTKRIQTKDGLVDSLTITALVGDRLDGSFIYQIGYQPGKTDVYSSLTLINDENRGSKRAVKIRAIVVELKTLKNELWVPIGLQTIVQTMTINLGGRLTIPLALSTTESLGTLLALSAAIEIVGGSPMTVESVLDAARFDRRCEMGRVHLRDESFDIELPAQSQEVLVTWTIIDDDTTATMTPAELYDANSSKTIAKAAAPSLTIERVSPTAVLTGNRYRDLNDTVLRTRLSQADDSDMRRLQIIAYSSYDPSASLPIFMTLAFHHPIASYGKRYLVQSDDGRLGEIFYPLNESRAVEIDAKYAYRLDRVDAEISSLTFRLDGEIGSYNIATGLYTPMEANWTWVYRLRCPIVTNELYLRATVEGDATIDLNDRTAGLFDAGLLIGPILLDETLDVKKRGDWFRIALTIRSRNGLVSSVQEETIVTANE